MLPRKDHATEKQLEPDSVFVDTSAWIALFSRRDQNHKSAEGEFRRLITSKRRLITTNLVLAEIHRLLLHRAGVQAAASALARIEASPLVQIEFPDKKHHQSAKAWIDELQEHPVSYTDAVSFAVMKDCRCTNAFTYDYHFRVAGFG